ncbi:MAG: hypothetical protein V1926_04830 [Candidatus Peregrinibacteria bacterium]
MMTVNDDEMLHGHQSARRDAPFKALRKYYYGRILSRDYKLSALQEHQFLRYTIKINTHMTPLSPTANTLIPCAYSAHSLDQKVKNKVALQKDLKWPGETKRPMACLPAGMTEELGGELLKSVIPGLLTLPMEIIILGKGSSAYGKLLTGLAAEHRHRIAIIDNTKEDIQRMYAAADMALFFSQTGAAAELAECLRFGVVPVAPRMKGLEPYDAVQESGCSFLYDQPTPWHCFAAIVRALETFQFPFDWRTIQKHCMESVQ